MKVLVHPAKGNYRILFFDESHIRGVGIVDITGSPKGARPDHYRLRWSNKKVYKNTPTKELLHSFRNATVELSRHDPLFESFLHDFQIPYSFTDLCRTCLLEDRITRLDPATSVKYGQSGERICFDCARRELKREVAHMGRTGRGLTGHLEDLLKKYRDIDRVLASIQPEQVKVGQTLFDRLEAHPITKTSRVEELPLPRKFIESAQVEALMPAQQLAVDAGLLFGKDLLVVAATASGKTFIGEMAGVKKYLEGRGQCLFLVPLVALAVQKYQRFEERYGNVLGTGILIGKSRVNLPDNRPIGDRNLHAALLVATYEGLDHLIRCGGTIGKIGTVVIDEVQMLEDPERGHRLDGMIARLKYLAPKAQFLYLSATIGSPKVLAKKLGATLVQYDERPVALERYLIFTQKKEKIGAIKQLTEKEYKQTSSKGYRGQSIIFTNSRARCHTIADALGPRYAAYHAGLTSQERREVERKFTEGKLIGVVTTAALGAGVDFPASQVIFDALSMGISWLSVGEFNQMAGRAGRPDFHDLGKVVVLAEPGATYSRESKVTEEEMALLLLKGEMEEVAPVYDREQSSEELVANAVVCKGSIPDLHAISESMVGSLEPVLDEMVDTGLAHIQGDSLVLTSLSRVMAEHFIGIERLLEIRRLVTKVDDPVEIVAELECEQTRDERIRDMPPRHGGGQSKKNKGPQRDARRSAPEKKPAGRKSIRKRSR
ncbi:MAG TPA: DEAD/DEAH box helicase [Methanoregulaceae archaeon]|nr:DEAD/DEAH box helicase [Methanoregulaceae archaeon]